MNDMARAALRGVGFVALFVLVAVLVVGETHPLAEGTAAPAIVGATLDGQPVQAVVKGARPTVVNIWATWCPPCLSELPHFVDAAQRWQGRVDFVGLAADSPVARVQDMIERFGIGYPIFLIGGSHGGQTQQQWNATALPSTYIVAADGRILWSVRGAIDGEVIDAQLARFAGP